MKSCRGKWHFNCFLPCTNQKTQISAINSYWPTVSLWKLPVHGCSCQKCCHTTIVYTPIWLGPEWHTKRCFSFGRKSNTFDYHFTMFWVVFIRILWWVPERAFKRQTHFKGDRCLLKIPASCTWRPCFLKTLYWNRVFFHSLAFIWQLALNALTTGQQFSLQLLQLPIPNRTSKSTERRGQQIHRAAITNDRLTGNRLDMCFLHSACLWMLRILHYRLPLSQFNNSTKF